MDNKLMSQAKFFSDGNVELFGVKGFSTITSGNALHAVGGNQTYRFEGDVTKFVAGNIYDALEGSVSREISGSESNLVGVDSVDLINRDKVMNIGGSLTQIISGGSPLMRLMNYILSTVALTSMWEILGMVLFLLLFLGSIYLLITE
jgi:hypothetical protein